MFDYSSTETNTPVDGKVTKEVVLALLFTIFTSRYDS